MYLIPCPNDLIKMFERFSMFELTTVPTELKAFQNYLSYYILILCIQKLCLSPSPGLFSSISLSLSLSLSLSGIGVGGGGGGISTVARILIK